MTSFDLPPNFHSDPESLLRRARAHLVSPRRSLSAAEPVIASSSAPRAMAQKTPCDYSAPSANQVPTGPEVNTGGENFEIKTGLITMVQASPFYGKANEDASAHLQQFLELCSTFVSRVYRKMLSGFIYFHSLSWGERSNGFMLTRLLWTLVTNVNSRSLGETSTVHSGVSAPRNGQLAHSSELLQRVDTCWYFVTSRIKSASARIPM